MNVLLAVLVVGTGSLLLRVVPLLWVARRLPDRVAAYAEYAGVAVLAAIVVRAVVLHQDADLPGAPLVALTATAAGLVVAYPAARSCWRSPPGRRRTSRSPRH